MRIIEDFYSEEFIDSEEFIENLKRGIKYEDFDPSYGQVSEPEVETFHIYLPGFQMHQLTFQLLGIGGLKVAGERPVEGNKRKWFRVTKGNKWSRFTKTFPVPPNLGSDRISATFETGVLHITLPKFPPDIRKYDLVYEPQADTIHFHLPDFTRDQLKVQFTSTGTLKISGNKPDGDSKWVRFTNEFPVTSDRDIDRFTETFEAGVLCVRIPALTKKTKPVEPEKPDEPEKSTKTDEQIKSVEPGELEKPVEEGSRPEQGKKTGRRKIEVEKAMQAAEIKRSKNMMNVSAAIMLVLGVGLYPKDNNINPTTSSDKLS